MTGPGVKRADACSWCAVYLAELAFACPACGALTCERRCLAGHCDERAARGRPECLAALLGEERASA